MEHRFSSSSSVLFLATIASFLTPFMGSAVNVALPSIGADFNAGAVILSWVAASYLLSSAMFLLPLGRAADLWGKRKILLAGLLVFTIGTLMAAFAPGTNSLIGCRVIQGIGSSMMFSTSLAMVTTAFPPEKRGKVIGLTIASVYLGLSLGPVFGGILTNYFGWRSIFLSIVPLGCWGIWLAGKFGENLDPQQIRYPFDIQGSLIYASSLFFVINGLSHLKFRSGIIQLLIGLAGLYLFFIIESKTEYPVLDVSLFSRNKIFILSNLAALINYSATFATGFMLSFYLQYIKSYSALMTGLILVTQPALQAILSPAAGWLSDRHHPRIVASAGMLVTAMALALMQFLSNSSELPAIILPLSALGIGFALFSSPNTNAVMSSVTPRVYGVASGILGSMRLLGQIFSMALASFIMSVFIGNQPISTESLPGLISSIRLTFLIMAFLCFIGVFASMGHLIPVRQLFKIEPDHRDA